MERTNFKTVAEYISALPENARSAAEQMRQTIKKAAPKAEEVISYQMPAFKYFGMLVYFAVYKNHVGFYPRASGIKAFQKELSSYEGAKGSVRFPMGQPLPLGLITKMVKYRAKENMEKETSRKNQL